MPILEWLNKGEATKVTKKLPYRILKANAELSYGEQSENMIIKGDNLEALQALLPYYKGQVKCIYIDPPYNTGGAFEHYDDNLEHSIWLSMLYPRLELLRELLSEDGFIFAQIDNYEMAYLKVLMDEIFGRTNFINDIVWKRKGGSVNPTNKLNNNTDYILWYAKSSKAVIQPVYVLNDDETQAYIKKRFTHEDKDGRKYRLSPIISPTYSQTLVYEYKGYKPPKNGWSLSYSKMEQFEAEGRLYMPEDKTQRIQRKQFLDEYKGRPIGNLWTDINVINPMSSERLEFVGQKPETLIERVFSLTTNEGDLVLDSFLGSGTTCAVAQKMGRRYIGIEMGEHAITHCVPRMKAVIDGEQGGISKAVNWQGGGGYTFYDLGETIFDENGNINKQVDFKTLASHIWFTETKTPLSNYEKSPLLGIHNGVAYYLLFNGILGDKKPDGGNVLTQKVYDTLPQYDGKKVIYGEATRMNTEKLKANNIVFKQTPYDVKAR